MITTLLVVLAATLLAAIGCVSWTLGARAGEERGRADARAELDKIAEAAAEASSRSAREDFDRATGQAVEQLLRTTKADRDASREAFDLATSQAVEQLKADRKAGQQELDKTTAPLKASLDHFQQLATDARDKSAEDSGKVRQLAKQVSEQMQVFQDDAQSLREALKGDRQARGRWGEVQLKALVESAGLVENCEYYDQKTHADVRPDLTVRLPGGARLAVDAKTPMDAYLQATEEKDPARREALLRAHTSAVKKHTEQLARKDYPQKLGDGPPYTVLFLPIESLLAEAIRHDEGLLQHAEDRRVILATPFTFLGLLWGVKAMWRHDRSTRNVEAMRDAALVVERRLSKFFEHMTGVAKALTRTNAAWNKTVGSGEHRLLPQLRKLRQLGGKPEDGGPLPSAVEALPRRPQPNLLDAASRSRRKMA